MQCFRLRLGCLLTAFMLNAEVKAFDDVSVTISPRPSAHMVPSGTFFSYDGNTVFLPGVQLPESLLSPLLLAGSDVVYRKLMHYLLQLTLESTAQYLSKDSLLWYVYKGIPYTLSAWNMAFNVLPKALNIAAHSWERTKTFAGWSRQGRMPVYLGGVLDKAVFIDFLIRTRENSDNQSRQLELTPLHRVNPDVLTSPWQKTMGRLVNTALDNNIDIVRITARESGEMQLEWHTGSGQWKTADTFYAVPENDQNYLTRWLEQSWSQSVPQGGLFSVLEPAALDCISARFTDRYAFCKPLSGMQPTKNNGTSVMTFMMPGMHNEDASSFLHIRNNRSLVPGSPGEIIISESSVVSVQDHRLSSTQYRVPRELTYVAEYMVYQVFYQVMDRTIGAGIEYANASWHGRKNYTHLKTLSGNRIPNSVQRMTRKDGTVYIRKQAPMNAPKNNPASIRYAYLMREAAIMKEINGNGTVKLHDSWLENAGSGNAQMVMIVEDGGQDLSHVSAQTMGEIKHLIKGSAEAIDNIHASGYAHFDIKPDNLVINKHGEVRLIDLETAARIDSQGNATPFLYDPRWGSPEIATGEPTFWKSDIWNLGATALSIFSNSAHPSASEIPEDVTGYRRFGPTLSETAQSIAQGKKLSTTPAFADFIKHSLSTSPDNRSSAQELMSHRFLN